ncbi:MAG: hypothetical protein A2236_06690 [Bacteroidetes bacterium RIFOXYA2_FULL_33_7]|nr:MAG: hypothetical protein A2236_06690 [Bacteroidetes bacterium RIFOXYA2_FULL_33_7]
MNKSEHTWKFARVGGIDRVCIDRGSDIMNLHKLDQKLWTALSCPIYGLELDAKTLELMDIDGDGRLRVNEILEAIKWIGSVLKNPNDLLKSENKLFLSSINDENEEGKKLLQSAKQILQNIGKTDCDCISVEDTSDTEKIFASTKFNGDGIITAETSENETIKTLISEIILCIGSAKDRSGQDGISTEILDAFYAQCQSFSDWFLLAEQDKERIFAFGENTEKAMQIFEKIKIKIDDYFLRCRLAQFDQRSAEILNMNLSLYENISAKNLVSCNDEISAFPLAFIGENRPLSLVSGINPAWENDIENFKTLVVDFVFKNKSNLTEKDWNEIIAKFEFYKNWTSQKPVVEVEKLGLERIREILSANEKAEIIDLIEKDKALEDEANSISKVEKLVRYYRDLYKLLKNFVTFGDFYSRETKAIFQAGILYIDRRSCDLCIKVTDIAKHSAIATQSEMYLIYCDCVSRKKNEKMQIVVALTNGDIDNLSVGRNGIFYDVNGNDWDATVVKIIENAVSIRQAFWSPYRRINKMIGSQIEKFASAKDKEVQDTHSAKIQDTATKVEKTDLLTVSKQAPAAAPATPPTPFDIGKFVGIFAAIGMAIGAIGTALVAIFSGFFNLSWWQMPLAVIGIMLAISGPAMILGYLKLRKRNLAPILDANGWAINARAVVNIVFGRTLTSVATLPLNAERNLKDPYSEKNFPYIPVILVSAIVFGFLFYYACKYNWINCSFLLHLINK